MEGCRCQTSSIRRCPRPDAGHASSRPTALRDSRAPCRAGRRRAHGDSDPSKKRYAMHVWQRRCDQERVCSGGVIVAWSHSAVAEPVLEERARRRQVAGKSIRPSRSPSCPAVPRLPPSSPVFHPSITLEQQPSSPPALACCPPPAVTARYLAAPQPRHDSKCDRRPRHPRNTNLLNHLRRLGTSWPRPGSHAEAPRRSAPRCELTACGGQSPGAELGRGRACRGGGARG